MNGIVCHAHKSEFGKVRQKVTGYLSAQKNVSFSDSNVEDGLWHKERGNFHSSAKK